MENYIKEIIQHSSHQFIEAKAIENKFYKLCKEYKSQWNGNYYTKSQLKRHKSKQN